MLKQAFRQIREHDEVKKMQCKFEESMQKVPPQLLLSDLSPGSRSDSRADSRAGSKDRGELDPYIIPNGQMSITSFTTRARPEVPFVIDDKYRNSFEETEFTLIFKNSYRSSLRLSRHETKA